MTREKLRNYKTNKIELQRVERSLAKLEKRLSSVPDVSIKVQKSSDEFPYIEEHVTVRAQEPKEATKLKERIANKKAYRDKISAEIDEVEKYIDDMSEGIKKDIFEMVYIDGMTQGEAADYFGYTQARISQIVNSV